ncbi:hypothetical protein [Bradyrhizobium sp. DOA1]|uniref:hypothetical protein n=1 Tax=Bradyrhizobium sp. DOA1 TaxID=1126616 RepID=UPI000AF6646D|nr:hypothetical protein [Bradyrhizobium sp. DOA1]
MLLQGAAAPIGTAEQSGWIVASAGGSMIQTSIKNKYRLDIEVSAADMADQADKRS